MRTAAKTSALLAVLVLAGCGGGGSSTSTTMSTATPPSTTSGGGRADSRTAEGPAETGTPSQSRAAKMAPPRQGSAQFRTPGGDNSIEEFGAEADRSELRAAAAALHGYLDARAAAAWGRACSHLSASYRHTLDQLATRSGKTSCAATLKALSAGAPRSALAEAAVADVRALRSGAARGFLLYYGAHHSPYGIPVVREGGAWRVGALDGVRLG